GVPALSRSRRVSLDDGDRARRRSRTGQEFLGRALVGSARVWVADISHEEFEEPDRRAARRRRQGRSRRGGRAADVRGRDRLGVVELLAAAIRAGWRKKLGIGVASTVEEPMVCRLTAGAKRIRTPGPEGEGGLSFRV